MTLEGWVPEIGPYLALDEVIEFAFDYRGNTTIVKTDGTEVVGYVFNRNRSLAVPAFGAGDVRVAVIGLRAGLLPTRWPALLTGLADPLVISAGVCGGLDPAPVSYTHLTLPTS